MVKNDDPAKVQSALTDVGKVCTVM